MENKFTDEILQGISKASSWIYLILIGVFAKISQDLRMKKKRNIWQWFGVIGLSIFVGYLTSIYCANNNLEKPAQYIVPMTTLFAEKIILYLSDNFTDILDFAFNRLKNKK